MMAGCSSIPFHVLVNLAMLAPSTNRWSADQETSMMWAGTRGSAPPGKAGAAPGRVDAYRGSLLILPIAPIAAVPGGMTGCAYVPPIVPMLERLRVGVGGGGQGAGCQRSQKHTHRAWCCQAVAGTSGTAPRTRPLT